MVQNQQCRRCREWVSVELDSPLSQFEQALMRRHLSRCADCASFAADVRGATALLRTAEAVPLPAPLALHLPRSAGQLLARTGMVAAVAAAAAAAVLTNGLTGTTPLGTTAAAQAQSTADLVSMRLDRSQQLRVSNERPRVIVVD